MHRAHHFGKMKSMFQHTQWHRCPSDIVALVKCVAYASAFPYVTWANLIYRIYRRHLHLASAMSGTL